MARRSIPLKTRFDKVAAFLLGILAVLVCLEVGLRVVDFIYCRSIASQHTQSVGGKLKILCLGDSFTDGYFSLTREQKYPWLLGRLFATRNPDLDVEVINGGRSGQNTYQIIRRLEENIDSFKPAVVVLLAGGCNEWDLFGYYRYLQGDSLTALRSDYLYRIRVFKLIKLLQLHFTAARNNSGTLGEEAFNLTFLSPIDLHGHKETDAALREMYENGLACFENRDFVNAERLLREVVSRNPSSVQTYVLLGWVLQQEGKREESVDAFLRAFEIQSAGAASNSDLVTAVKILKCLYFCCITEGRHSVGGGRSTEGGSPALQAPGGGGGSTMQKIGSPAEEDYSRIASRRLADLERRNPLMKRDLAIFREMIDSGSAARIEAWIRGDIDHIIDYCRQRNIDVVLQNYPLYPGSYVSKVQQSLYKKIAEAKGVPFVDQAESFAGLPDREKYYVRDRSHPNPLGNELMAENVYATLLPLVRKRLTRGI